MFIQVTRKFTVVSFGYISQNDFPDWVYHNFDRRFSEDTAAALCSVELLAIETIGGRLVTNLTGGNTLEVPFLSASGDGGGDGGGGGDDSMTFHCMHYRSQHFVRIPGGLGDRVPHNLPLWCLPPPSRGDEFLEKRVEQACGALRTTDLRLELFVKSNNAKPDVNVTTHFTTTMGSYPIAERPDISKDIVIHAVMPYHRVDRFNKIIFHMWLSYHAIMGFYVVSSVPNIDFYDELPRHVAKHPNIAHYDSTILGAVHQSSSSQYNNPYVVEFEKMMLATFVRFEYRVLYGARFVINADPDEFVMAPHGPGFEKYNFSPFKDMNTSIHECDPKLLKWMKPKHSSVKQNEALYAKYLSATSNQSSSDFLLSPSPPPPPPPPPPVAATVATDKTNLVPLSLTNWRWTDDDKIGIKQQAKYIRWVVSEVFALSVNRNSTRTNLGGHFTGKAIEVVMHKQYVSTENTTSACVADMLNSTQNDVYTFSKCFDYVSVMHPGTNPNYIQRSKYININQGCVSDTIHYSCVQNNHMHFKNFISSSAHCLCHKVINQPYLFLMHFRANSKEGGHPLHQIHCAVTDHEDTVLSEFSLKGTQPKIPYKY
jgi:hypothetical protein